MSPFLTHWWMVKFYDPLIEKWGCFIVLFLEIISSRWSKMRRIPPVMVGHTWWPGGARREAAGGARDAAAGRAGQFLFRASGPSLQHAVAGALDIPLSIAQSTAHTKRFAAWSILQRLLEDEKCIWRCILTVILAQRYFRTSVGDALRFSKIV
jgi:hypothetical protein